jgi:hypothetical protein
MKNNNRTAGFLDDERPDFYRENLLGKWMAVSQPHGTTLGGLVMGFTYGHLVLNPHMAPIDFDPETGEIMALVPGNQYIDIVPGMRYGETTEARLRNYCAYENAKSSKRKPNVEPNGTPKTPDNQ